MNNLKKIGLNALAASLVSTSAFAGALTVAGSAGINYENYQAADSTTSASNGTKAFSMGNQITFSGSGELDNGMSVSLSFVLDQNDDSTAAGAAYSGGPFDGHSVTVSSDSMGSLKFSGEGADSAANAVGDTAAGNIWDLWDARNGSTSKMKESNATTNMFNYTFPSMVDGLTLAASYVPAGANDESDTAYSVTYTGIEGLTASYGSGTDDDAAGTGANADQATMKLSYAYGPVTLAYSDHEYDTNTASSDQDITAYKLSYTVSDAISVSYAQETIDSENTSHIDAEYTRISASYTAGGMTISGNMSEMENGTHSTATAGDEEYVGLSVSFAF
jgi:outer membrane protein OmpU